MIRPYFIRRIFDVRVLLWSLVFCCALSGASMLPAQEYPFRHYERQDGLMSSNIFAIHQDAHGYLWLGTGAGVVRFDGHDFVSLADEFPAAGTPTVRALLEDRAGRMWFGTVGLGAGVYDGKSVRWYTMADGLGSDDVRALLEDREGRIWFGTRFGGLSVLDGDTIRTYTTADGLPDNRVLTLAEDASGDIWIGTSQGLVRFDGTGFRNYTTVADRSLSRIHALYADRAGSLWIGSSRGLYRYDGDTFSSYREQVAPPPGPFSVRAFAEDHRGNLWIGTSAFGVLRYDGAGFTRYTTENGLSGPDVRAIMEDREGNLWFGTFGRGLDQFPGDQFLTVGKESRFAGERIYSFLQDSRGRYLFGTSSGLYVQDGAHSRYYGMADGSLDNGVNAIMQDRQGRIWLAYTDAVSMWDGARFRTFRPPDDGMWCDVWSLAEDSTGAVWFATELSGLVRWDGQRLTTFTERDGLANNFMAVVLTTADGVLWAGGNGGLSRYDGGTFETFHISPDIEYHDFICLIQAPTGDLWCVINKRLYRFDGARFFPVLLDPDGGVEDCFWVLQRDSTLYTGTRQGIARIDPRTSRVLERHLGAYAPMLLETPWFAYCDAAGTFWFGSAYGVTRFTPDLDHAQRPRVVPPPTVIARIHGTEGDTLQAGGLTLPPGAASLTIDYTALNFSFPELVNYRYRLVGADAAWTETSRRSVSFPFLPPGEYRFEVTSRIHRGPWHSEPAALAITALPPFWQTWWFQGMWALGLGMAIWGGIVYRERQGRRREAALEAAVRERTAELQTSEDKYQDLYDNAPDMFASVNAATGKILQCNNTLIHALGYEKEEIIDRHIFQFYHPDSEEVRKEVFRRFVAGEEIRDVELELQRKDGSKIPVSLSVSAVRDELGQVVRSRSIWRDITERKQAEAAIQKLTEGLEQRVLDRTQALTNSTAALRRNEQKLMEANRIAKMGYWEWDLTTNKVSWSVEIYTMFGLSPETCNPTFETFRHHVHPDDIGFIETSLQATIDKSEPYSLDYRFVRSDGEIRYMHSQGTVQRDDTGKPIRVIGISQDITDRKLMEQQLHESQQMLDSIVKGVPDIIYRLQPDGSISFISDAVKQYGCSPEELIGRNILEFVHPDDREKAKNRINERRTGDRGTHSFEVRFVLNSDHAVPFEVNDREIADDPCFLINAEGLYSSPTPQSHSHIGTQGIARDITERKKMEDTLRASEERFDLAVRGANDGLWDRPDLTRDEEWWSPRLFELLGYQEGEIKAAHSTFQEIAHPNDTEKADNALRRHLTDNTPFDIECRLRTKAGEYRWFRDRGQALWNDDGKPYRMSGSIQDIHERKLEGETLLRLATAITHAGESIYITDADGTIQFVNPAFVRITGYSSAEAIGQNPRMLKSGRHDAAFYRTIWDTLLAGKVWEGQFVNRRKNGKEYMEEGTISPIFNTMGDIVNFVAVRRDVTRQHEMEAQLRQSQKMEAVGLLAGGVAHDFNNLLTVILNNSMLMQRKEDLGTYAHTHLEHIIQASRRGASLTQQLLAFGRKEISQPIALDITSHIRETEKMLSRLIPAHIAMTYALGTTPLWVNADPGQLDQVLINLVVNARDAMPQGGRLMVVTELVTVGGAVLHRNGGKGAKAEAGIPDGSYVCMQVTDTGCGMTSEVQARLFEPFFTTKAVGKGTGLGLSTVYGIIQQHDGYIQVESEEGRGTTFLIYLPEEEPAEASACLTPTRTGTLDGAETILLVEDDAIVRKSTKSLLQSHGYRVIEAVNGEDGLSVLRRGENTIDLMITDVIMPEMTGRDLVDAIRESHPQLKIIFVSGYTDDVIGDLGIFDEGIVFISKPFDIDKLATQVRHVLDG